MDCFYFSPLFPMHKWMNTRNCTLHTSPHPHHHPHPQPHIGFKVSWRQGCIKTTYCNKFLPRWNLSTIFVNFVFHNKFISHHWEKKPIHVFTESLFLLLILVLILLLWWFFSDFSDSCSYSFSWFLFWFFLWFLLFCLLFLFLFFCFLFWFFLWFLFWFFWFVFWFLFLFLLDLILVLILSFFFSDSCDSDPTFDFFWFLF